MKLFTTTLSLFIIIAVASTNLSLQAQTATAPQFFTADGSLSNYQALLSTAKQADIILFGELHDDSLCHTIELQLLTDLYAAKQQQLIVGAEMLESDQQIVLNEYLTGLISEKNFKEALQLWKNYTSDYAPLVNYAKAQKLPFIAANIPRRYASMVFRGGFESLSSLSKAAKKYIAPLPIPYNANLPNYQAMLEMGGMGHDNKANLNFPRAQAIKDATMAHFILKNWKQGKTLIHFNGAYHSNNREGIVWYLLQSKPKLKIVTISTVHQTQTNSLDKENTQLADFILVIQALEEIEK